ncbi:hypothetical protein Y695_00265 [Hydrogenophaga sp. T4]|nr:hypothetical protein Y695_00265 [Hydrogenophaga sp. T4]
MKPPRLFVNREAPPKRRSQTLEDFARTYKGAFSSLEDTQHYFAHLFTPASRRWLYAGNGKSGTTSTKRFLFELEFGIPLTVHLVAEHDINSDAQSHMLAKAGIFRPLTALPDAIKVFNTALRITTARHPVARALSSFRYLCLSDQLKHSWLVSDRMRMNAMVGFDWNRDPDTNGGFRKFLQYAELSMSTQATGPTIPTGVARWTTFAQRCYAPTSWAEPNGWPTSFGLLRNTWATSFLTTWSSPTPTSRATPPATLRPFWTWKRYARLVMCFAVTSTG